MFLDNDMHFDYVKELLIYITMSEHIVGSELDVKYVVRKSIATDKNQMLRLLYVVSALRIVQIPDRFLCSTIKKYFLTFTCYLSRIGDETR